MSDSAKWYVIHTYSGYENKVMTNLETIVENRKLHDLMLKFLLKLLLKSRTTKPRKLKEKFFPVMFL